MANTLQQLILKYPYKILDKLPLMINACITYSFVKQNKEFFDSSCNINTIICNSSITFDDIKKLLKEFKLDKPLINKLAIMGVFTIDEAELMYDNGIIMLPDDHIKFGYNPRIDLRYKSKYDLKYYYDIYSKIPWDMIELTPDIEIGTIAYIGTIYSNPTVTLDIIRDNVWLSANVSYINLSKNPNITIDFVIDCLNGNYIEPKDSSLIGDYEEDREFDWKALSINYGITLEDIAANPQLSWNYEYIVSNRYDLTLSFIDYLIDNDKYTINDTLLTNPSFTIDEILSFRNYYSEVIKYEPHKVVNLLYQNPRLTIDDIMQYEEYDNWFGISCNQFECSPNYITAMECKDKRKMKVNVLTDNLNRFLIADISKIVVSYVMFT